MIRKFFKVASFSVAGALCVAPAMAQNEDPMLDAILGEQPEDESASRNAPELEQPEVQQPEAVPAAPRRSSAIEEVVVTARRREEGIQSVPVAVTAVSGEALERAGVTDVNSLATQVPSLVIVPSSSGSRSIPTFAIRGQSQQEQSFIADPSVPVYFNEVAAQRAHGINQSMFDLQAVEVLKGPQGTLFGRNSTGGAVLIRPNRPSQDFEGYVGQTWGSHDRRHINGMVNIPLADWAQLRVAGQSIKSDGYVYDTILGRNIDHENSWAGRVSLALQPTDSIDSVFMYSRFYQDEGATGGLIVDLNPGSIVNSGHPAAPSMGFVGDRSGEQMLADQRARGIYDTASGVEQYNRVATWDLSNITTWSINDTLGFKSIIGTRQVSSDTFEDVDGLPVPLMHIHRIAEFEQYSGEFHLTGSTERLDWIVGTYLFEEKGDSQDYSVTAKGISSAPGNQTPQPKPIEFPGWSLTWPGGKNTSKSIFAQGTHSLDMLVDGLAITAGVRYTWDERTARIRNRSGNATDPAATPICRFSRNLDGDPNTPETPAADVPIEDCDVSFTETFSEPTWNLSLDYQLNPDHLIYIANRRGYRTGGFGARAATEEALSQTFDAETVTDYEIGNKSTFDVAGMPLRLNIALFYSDYKDIQRLLQTPDFNPPQTVPANAGKATIKGGELEFAFMPTDNLEFSGFWSYTDAGYDEFIDPGTGEDRSNQPFARAPKNIYSLTTRYHLPMGYQYGQGSLQATWFHTDGYSTNDTFAPQQSVSSYSLLNLRADWQNVMGSNFDLGTFVRNALNKEYLISYSDLYTTAVLGHVSRTPGAPRTVGLEVRYRFGAAGY